MQNLLHVPQITKNLISVSKFAKDNNVYFEFHPSICCVKSQESDKVLVEGSLGDDGLYHFHQFQIHREYPFSCQPSAHSISTTSSSNKSCFMTWQARLRHAHSSAFKTVLQLCNAPLANTMIPEFCGACCLGKAHRLHVTSSHAVLSISFELIYTDLWGPAPFLHLCGYSYFVTFVDAYSRYTWLYILKHKSEALTVFKQFSQLVSNQFGTNLKRFNLIGGKYRPFT